MGNVGRKTRADKKREIKANLPVEIRQICEHNAGTLGLTLKSYLERLALAALGSDSVLDALSPYCRRTYIHGNRAIFGRVVAPSLDALMPEGTEFKRVSCRFVESDYLWVGEISYALATKSMTQALTILIAEGLVQNVVVRVDEDGATAV